MKKIFLFFALTGSVIFTSAQSKPSGTEKALADTICQVLSKLDLSKINTKDEAVNAFTSAFLQHTDMLMKLADEQHVDAADDAAMRKIGEQIGKDLMAMNCEAFTKVSLKMVQNDAATEGTGVSQGTFKRIDQKGFNYIVLSEAGGSEKSFLWLREFTGSDKFSGSTAQFAGKKLKIEWREIEVYLPQAKGYYKVKEITGITLL